MTIKGQAICFQSHITNLHNIYTYIYIQWNRVNPEFFNPENSLSGHILQGTDFFFINLTRLYGNSRSRTGNPKQGTKCTLSIESRFVNPEMLIIKCEMC